MQIDSGDASRERSVGCEFEQGSMRGKHNVAALSFTRVGNGGFRVAAARDRAHRIAEMAADRRSTRSSEPAQSVLSPVIGDPEGHSKSPR